MAAGIEGAVHGLENGFVGNGFGYSGADRVEQRDQFGQGFVEGSEIG